MKTKDCAHPPARAFMLCREKTPSFSLGAWEAGLASASEILESCVASSRLDRPVMGQTWGTSALCVLEHYDCEYVCLVFLGC